MNSAHIHLMLNHFPVVGIVSGLALQIIATVRGSVELKKSALHLIVATGAIAGLVFLTGREAGEQLLLLPGISQPAILTHNAAAFYAMVVAVAGGLVALGGLTILQRDALTRNWFWFLSLLLTAITTAIMAWTANLGGQIRHPEIRNQVRLITRQDSLPVQDVLWARRPHAVNPRAGSGHSMFEFRAIIASPAGLRLPTAQHLQFSAEPRPSAATL